MAKYSPKPSVFRKVKVLKEAHGNRHGEAHQAGADTGNFRPKEVLS
jgi:hypothetical protein